MIRPPSPRRPAPGRGRRGWWRALRGGLCGAVVALVLGAVVGAVPVPAAFPGSSPSSSGPVGALLAAPAACAAPASEGTIAVAVAVDPGGVSGMAGGPETMCVTVPVGASGADVLAARARALGRPVPRYNSAGLLCAIDGQPATGCGERVDGAYRYWAYFLGTGGWTYAGTGPALRRASATQLEGWRFVAGAGNATDPPPRTTATPSAVCPPPAPPTTAAVAPAPTPTSAAPLPGPADGSGMGGPGTRGDATVGGAGATAGSGSTGGSGSSAGAADPSGGDGGDAGPGATTDDAERVQGSAGEAGSGGDAGRGADELAGAPVADTTAGGGPPLGALLAAVLVVAFAVGAFVQVRRRDAS